MKNISKFIFVLNPRRWSFGKFTMGMDQPIGNAFCFGPVEYQTWYSDNEREGLKVRLKNSIHTPDGKFGVVKYRR